MSEVFISYSRTDRFFAELLSRELINLGVDVFWDRSIPAGSPWTKSVDNAIKKANYILVCLSPDYISSSECQRQLNLSILCESEGDALVVPMILENCKIPDLLYHKAYADFRLNFSVGLDALTYVLLAVGAGVIEPILVGHQRLAVSNDRLAKLKQNMRTISANKSKPPRVFLCHAQEDKKHVDQVYFIFGDSGLDPWYDKTDLIVGDHWKLEIFKAIEQSDFFVIFLSDVSIKKRGFIQHEIRIAVQEYQNRPDGMVYFIPVRLDDCKVPAIRLDANTTLSDIQWTDLNSNSLGDILGLAKAIWGQWNKRMSKS